MAQQKGLRECPFCGCEVPDLRFTGPYAVDDGREYRVTVQCEGCDCLVQYEVGYKQYLNLGGSKAGSSAAEFMFGELFKKWNQRSGYKITLEVT